MFLLPGGAPRATRQDGLLVRQKFPWHYFQNRFEQKEQTCLLRKDVAVALSSTICVNDQRRHLLIGIFRNRIRRDCQAPRFVEQLCSFCKIDFHKESSVLLSALCASLSLLFSNKYSDESVEEESPKSSTSFSRAFSSDRMENS